MLLIRIGWWTKEETVPMGRSVVTATVVVVAMLAVAMLAAGAVMAADKGVEIPLVIEKNRFQPDVLKVKAGVPFVIVITNKDKGPEEFDRQRPRIEKVVPGGKTVRLQMPALPAGKYPFVGEY